MDLCVASREFCKIILSRMMVERNQKGECGISVRSLKRRPNKYTEDGQLTVSRDRHVDAHAFY
jgi:hypothetical protein